MIDRNRPGSAERRGVLIDHRRKVEPLADFWQHGHAELPAAVRDHEVDDLGSDLFGGTDEVAFVFAVFGVDDDHDLAGGDGFDRQVDCGKAGGHGGSGRCGR